MEATLLLLLLLLLLRSVVQEIKRTDWRPAAPLPPLRRPNL
jgi:hypothetical protein